MVYQNSYQKHKWIFKLCFIFNMNVIPTGNFDTSKYASVVGQGLILDWYFII